MPDKNHTLHLTRRSLIITGCLLVLALALLLIFASSATSAPSPSARPTMLASIGFDGRYKNGTWVPVHIALSNTGADFTGTLTISPPSGLNTGWPTTLYQSSITLPTGAQKQFTSYIPLNSNTTGTTQTLHVQLLNTHGHLILTQPVSTQVLTANDIFVGLLSDRPASFGALTSVDLPNPAMSVLTQQLTTNTFPTEAAVLNNFDMLVLDNFTSSSLNNDQLRALQAWIQHGGALFEVGGPSWQRSLSSLPTTLLPVTVSTTSLLPNSISLLPLAGPQSYPPQYTTLPPSVLISKATLAPTTPNIISTIILATGNTPLLMQRQQGLGTVSYLAFDPTLEPLASWQGIHTFWQSILLRTLGAQLLTPNTGPPILPANGNNSITQPILPLIGASIESLLSAMQPYNLPVPWPLITVIACYLLILGPIRLLFVRYTKRRWSWHIILSSIIIFSSLAYGLALHEKDDSVFGSSISILQFNQNGAPVHTTTYTGIFLPDHGSFRVTLPGTSLTQALPNAILAGDSPPQQANIVTDQSKTTINLTGKDAWTMHTFISEQDRPLNGNLSSHLTLNQGILTGTITNTLPYSFTDTYILTAKGYIHSGPLLADHTRTVHSSFKITTDPTETLADQITADSGLPAAYDLSSTNQLRIKTPSEQHLEILTALSGELSSSSCGLSICTATNSKHQQPFGNPAMFSVPGGDPLLLANASATLIGWTNPQPSQIITVNGSIAHGTHTILAQMPLTIHSSPTAYVPPSVLTTQLINVQGNSIQTQPGIYLMTTGSMTFELPLPQTVNIETQPLKLSLMPYPPDGVYQLGGIGIRNIANEQHLHASLYNWQTGAWDTTTFTLYTLTIHQQQYLGPHQRVLLKLANQDTSQDIFVIGTPIATF